MLAKLSYPLNFYLMLQFQSYCNRIARIFVVLTDCKSEVQLSGQQKVLERKVAEETVVERPSAERSTNKKIVAEAAMTK